MKRHKQLWPIFCTWDNFSLAAKRMLKGKRMSREGARFSARWEDEVCRLLHELESGNYRPGPYHYFTIHEPKERMVAAAPMRDRLVHHALVQVLEPLFEPRFIEDSYACRKGKGTHAGMMGPRKSATNLTFKLPKDEVIDTDLEAAGLDTLEYNRWGAYRIKLVPGDLPKNHDLLQRLLKAAYEYRE
jgi:hypothetical protein